MEEATRLARLLGSRTRANMLEALATTSGRPLTAYRISKMYNMNTAKVYLEAKRLQGLGLVDKVEGGKKGAGYLLADDDLRKVALKLASKRVIAFAEWSSASARTRRFRDGLAPLPDFALKRRVRRRAGRPLESKPGRLPGELENLVALARKRFAKRYRRIGDRKYVLL